MLKFCKIVLTFFTTIILLVACRSHPVPTPAQLAIQTHNYGLMRNQTIYVDSAFTERELTIIKSAADEWERATNGTVHFTLFWFAKLPDHEIHTYVPYNTMIRLNSNNQHVFETDLRIRDNTAGFLQTTSGSYYIGIVADRITVESLLKSVVIHEMGHALGLDHDDSSPAIMNRAAYYREPCLSYSDLNQFCNRYRCNVAQMSFCVYNN